MNVHTCSSTTTADRIRPAARTWVAQSFFGPLLKQARESPLADASSPLAGGRGGQAFGSLLDAHLAERTTGPGDRLAEVLVRRIAGTR